ncbi:unnamed protein product [Prunus armeniaca]|uniref:Pre-SET domain-containing protein n=1 Tax=Prunus armeniaca TaxID=36596 RepID=A0A6J5WBG6_PRUAR|nr:unnamed protein product [Prunus armeniaca]
MPPKNSRMADACRAMKPFGISEGQTKAAVKELLKVYANSWEFIIDENYRLLLDQKPEEEKFKCFSISYIFVPGSEIEEKEAPSYDKTEVVELPTKRYCTRQQKNRHCLLWNLALKIRRSRRRHQEREVLDSGNNFDPLRNCNTQLEESLNLIGEDSSSDFDEDGLKLLEVESLNTDNKDNVFDLPQFVAASSTPKGDLEMSMICHSSPQSDFCPPHFDEALEMMEETHINHVELKNALWKQELIPPLMKVLHKMFLPADHNYHSSLGVIKSCVYIDGEERVKVSLENGRNTEDLPIFLYISNNLVYKNAYVKFSLARISHEGFCSHCFGDCLTSSVPCLCAAESWGQFAYTLGGFIKEKFLEECISLKWEPKQDH